MKLMQRMKDFILDERLPHYIPIALTKRMRIKKLVKISYDIDELLIALTFDVEKDLGSLVSNQSFRSVKSFLDKMLKKELENMTFFIQGNLIKNFADQLNDFAEDNEIGLHSYAHELWGNPKWFIKDDLTPISLREEYLKISIQNFIEAGLDKPSSFRAPNLVIDKSSLILLDKYKFRVDSSPPSYNGLLPIPSQPLGKESKLLSIPISVDPTPKLKFKYFVPYINYDVISIKTLIFLSDESLIDLINSIASIQKALGFTPTLCF